MMVGHLGVVEDPLGLRQLTTYQRTGALRECGQMLDDVGTLVIDVIRQETGIDTWIGREFALI